MVNIMGKGFLFVRDFCSLNSEILQMFENFLLMYLILFLKWNDDRIFDIYKWGYWSKLFSWFNKAYEAVTRSDLTLEECLQLSVSKVSLSKFLGDMVMKVKT